MVIYRYGTRYPEGASPERDILKESRSMKPRARRREKEEEDPPKHYTVRSSGDSSV